MALKENLKKIRKTKNISQQKLAELSGLSFSMVSKLESGEQSNPTLETIEKISFALGVEPSVLIGKGKYFDMKFNPDGQLVKEIKEWECFINYLESIGYTVEIEPEVLEWHYEDVIENKKVIGRTQVADKETYTVKITKDKATTIFSESEFEEFRNTIEKSVEFEIYKANQNK
ncbi:MAG: helix-turn-helix transcriptional regulator [Thermoanaerobacteraceae bacterium]|nr:helix-turn-helix transcriptional regulator [Thermoanaerobacteraceae bacterium]